MNDLPLHHIAHTSTQLTVAACLGTLDMDESTLRKLTRAKLQKLAKENKIKANMKSETIIQELLKLCKVVPQHQGEEPPRESLRISIQEQPPGSIKSASEDVPSAAISSTQIIDVPVDTSLDHPPTQEGSQKSALSAEKYAPITPARDPADIASVNSAAILQGPSSVPESHAGHTAPGDDTSDADSDLSYASQHGSPHSSRLGTPPLEEPRMLNRAVEIMNQITLEGDLAHMAKGLDIR